jgi:hypothetical protein
MICESSVFFWGGGGGGLGRQEPRYTTEMEDHPSHMMMWRGITASRANGRYFLDGTVSVASCFEALYQS